MELIVSGSTVSIVVTGMEQLRLRAKLAPVLGPKMQWSKDSITFPKSCMLMVNDLLGCQLETSPVIEEVESYRKHAEAREQVGEIVNKGSSTIDDSFWFGILEPSQAVAVKAMTTSGLLGLCLFDEQGSGKTVMTISAFDLLRRSDVIDEMIVVCPKSMLGEWPKDLSRFLGNAVNVLIASGSTDDRFKIAQSHFDVLIATYEGLQSMLLPLKRRAISRRILLVVDESYYAKNEVSRRSETVTSLREHCAKCFVLCGTPAPNSAYDLINQFNLADLGFTFGEFSKSSDVEFDRDKIATLVDTRGAFIRRLKTAVLQFVPEKHFHVITVHMTGTQKYMYERARHDLELELRGYNNLSFKKKVSSYLQKRSTLLQICCCPSAVNPMAGDDGAKYSVLDDLLESLISKGRKVVIWTFFKKSVEELTHRYTRFNPVRIDGSVHTRDRQNAVDRFQTENDVMLFIGNPAAAGAGITLHASYDAVYLSYSNQAAHYLQSLDRIHRRGQLSETVNYYLLVCEKTIEESEVRRLRTKELNQHALLGDSVSWPTSLDDALAELRTGYE